MQNKLHNLDAHIMDWLKHLDDVIPNLITDMITDTKIRFDLFTNVNKQLQNKFEAYLVNTFQVTNY